MQGSPPVSGSASSSNKPSRSSSGRVRKGIIGLVTLIILLAGILIAYVQIFPERVAQATLNGWRKDAGLESKEITLPDGLRYAYLEGGTGDPLLLLHGFGADTDNFAPVARFLTPHYRLIVPDHVGFGNSSHPADADYTPPAQAARIHRFMQALGVKRMHLGGSSMGGQIAITYAARYSNEVDSLWLLAPAGLWKSTKSEVLTRIAEGKRNPMLVQTVDEFEELFGLVMDPRQWGRI